MRILFLSRSSHHVHPGGDSIHLEQTARFLRERGHEVLVAPLGRTKWEEFDVVHLFNLTKPMAALKALGKSHSPPMVCSAIFIDPRIWTGSESAWQLALQRLIDPEGWTYLRHIYHWLRGQEKGYSWTYLIEGQRASVQKLLYHLSCLITATSAERDLIEQQYQISSASRVIPLGTEHLPNHASTSQRKGVLYVARIEPLKNQLALIKACRELDWELTLIGSASRNHLKYYERCRALAGEKVHFLGDRSLDEVATAMAQAQVHLSASWYESTGLSSIEALASGCSIGVIDHPIQRELFGQKALYHRGTADSIKSCLQEAMNQTADHRTWARQNFSWQRAAEKLEEIYKTVQKEKAQ